jgi:PleD family two-component response regulator
MQAISETIENNALKIVEYLLGSVDIAGSPQDNPKGRQWYQARIYPLTDHNNEINSAIWFPINITQRKYLEDQVTDLSVTDSLTGAFNRKYFLQIFENEFAISKRYNNKLSVLHIAIDKLQKINDTYGKAGGDAVIIAERIRAIAEELRITHEEETIQFAISIGISQMLESDNNSSAVLTRADSAIYQAKIKGRNRIEIL